MRTKPLSLPRSPCPPATVRSPCGGASARPRPTRQVVFWIRFQPNDEPSLRRIRHPWLTLESRVSGDIQGRSVREVRMNIDRESDTSLFQNTW